MVLAMGQFGFLLVIPVLLQDGQHFTALRTGAYMVPMGALIALGAPLGARFTRLIGTTRVVRIGLVLEAVGLAVVALMISTHTTLLALLPGSALFGIGVGFASSQLTNVILSDVDRDKAGVASGTNTTVRQVGAALGIAVIGSLLNAQAIRHAVRAVGASALIPAQLKASTIAGIRAKGVNYAPGAGATRGQAAELTHALQTSVVNGARPALFFAAGVVTIGASSRCSSRTSARPSPRPPKPRSAPSNPSTSANAPRSRSFADSQVIQVFSRGGPADRVEDLHGRRGRRRRLRAADRREPGGLR